MKSILKMLLIGMVCVTLRADILRLRDGRMLTGQFLGATRTEIWFQCDTPGNVLGARAFPVEQVESVTFGPAPKQSKADRRVKKASASAVARLHSSRSATIGSTRAARRAGAAAANRATAQRTATAPPMAAGSAAGT